MDSNKEFDWFLTRRCRPLNSIALQSRNGDYILCWLQQTLRGESNPVIDAALALGRKLGKPVVIYHGIGVRYPHASARLHRFMMEASRSLEFDVQGRGIRFIRYVETIDNPHPQLVSQLADRACAVVLDDQPAFIGRWQAQRFATRSDKLVVAVDGNRLVPELALGMRLLSTVAFRARHGELRERWLQEPHDLIPNEPMFTGELPIESTDLGTKNDCKIDRVLSRCDIDHTVPPVDWCVGDRPSALGVLSWALTDQIPGYSVNRNNPAIRSTSHLSPHLHFGVLWPGDIAPLVSISDGSARDKWKYLDELLTWREYFHHNALHEQDPSAYNSVPMHARETLKKHACDEREHIYTLGELIHGTTNDELWNIAQRQFLQEGWMHNNLRMYWGKKIIGWTTTPLLAWETACYLNDRFSLDGRDPATYGNLKWCFGAGRESSEVNVYGTVPRKTDRSLRSRPGVSAWIELEAAKPYIEVSVPENIPASTSSSPRY